MNKRKFPIEISAIIDYRFYTKFKLWKKKKQTERRSKKPMA